MSFWIQTIPTWIVVIHIELNQCFVFSFLHFSITEHIHFKHYSDKFSHFQYQLPILCLPAIDNFFFLFVYVIQVFSIIEPHMYDSEMNGWLKFPHQYFRQQLVWMILNKILFRTWHSSNYLMRSVPILM